MRYLPCMAVVFAAAFLSAVPVMADGDPGQAAFDRGDFAKAKAIWLGPAQKGVPGAQLGLGRMLLSQADRRGLAWIKKSAQAGYLPAEYQLGTMYLTGSYVGHDAVKGVTLLQRAIAHPAAEESAHPLAAARVRHLLYRLYALP